MYDMDKINALLGLSPAANDEDTTVEFMEDDYPEEAHALTNRLEIHYTPKHGNWLNIAECEFSVLQRQCLSRRMDCAELLAREVGAWESARNQRASKVNWQFKTDDARIKLRRLYPEFLRPGFQRTITQANACVQLVNSTWTDH